MSQQPTTRPQPDASCPAPPPSTTAPDADPFHHHLAQFDHSKTIKLLNLLYSLTVGLLSTQILKIKGTRHARALGVLVGVLCFVAARVGLRLGTAAKGTKDD